MKKKIYVLSVIMLASLIVLAACGSENAKPGDYNGIGGEINNSVEKPDEENTNNQDNSEETSNKEFILQNDAFKIYEPEVDQIQNRLIVRGLARVFEATIQYEFEDGHYLFEEGFVTAKEGAPSWGEFEVVIELEEFKVANNTGIGRVILFEESAKDGSRLHEIHVPINIGK